MSEKVALYLASTSPRRRELLRQIGVEHRAISVHIDERSHINESPQDYVQRLSKGKAESGWLFAKDNGLEPLPVLGSDTTVVLDGEILGKPANLEQCVSTLLALSGKVHQVMTAVTIKHAHRVETVLSVTDVTFRELIEDDAVRYWNTGEPQDKAGSYGIQGYGGVFVEHIAGSYSGVVGLPIEKTVELLKLFRVPFWQNGDA